MEFCRVEKEGHLSIITMCRPERMNALHAAASQELQELWDEFEQDPEQWVAIVTGEGDKAFCAGNDLKAQASGEDTSMPSCGFGGLTARYHMVKPVIAAVNGVAMGGGFEIALSADIIIAANSARFALPEPKVGLAALAGGMHKLPRMIGFQRAMGMLLTGRHVSAEEGKELGFVNEVAESGKALELAKQWAAQILDCSPMSIRATKQSVVEGLREPDLQRAVEGDYAAVTALFQSEDLIEGPMAFAQKRKPEWKGR